MSNPTAARTLLGDDVHRLAVAAAVLLYALLLQVGYVAVVARSFSYMGYEARSVDWLPAAVGTLLAALPVVAAPLRLDRPSSFVAWLLLYIVHVPTVTIPFWSLHDPVRFLPFALLQTLVVAMLMSVHAWPRWSPRLPRLPRVASRLLLPVLGLALLAVTLAAFGVRLPTLSLEFAYEARAGFSDRAGTVGRLATYAVGWLGLVLVPVAIASALAGRRRLWVVAAAALQIYVYGITGYKSLLMALPLTIGAWWLANRGRRSALPLGLAVVAMVAAVLALAHWTGELTPMSVFFRRLLVTPGLLAGYYFDFFAGREPVIWSHALLSEWITYPLPEPYPRLISLQYLYGQEGSANVHFLSDGFVQLGYAGMLLVGTLTAAVLWVADALGERLPRGLAVAALAMPCSALANSALNTSLLTHGILLALLVLAALAAGGGPGRRGPA